MRATTWMGVLLGLGLLLSPGAAWAVDPSASVNAAGVIKFPTALNQTNDNGLHLTLDVFDIGEPDLRGENLRYGYQWGDVQMLLDFHAFTRPKNEIDFGELRVKLRVLPLDEIRTTLAIGLLGRYADTPEGEARLGGHEASLFAIVTNQVYLFGSIAVLSNFYLDNVFTSLGFKMEIYQFISLAAEGDYYHSLPDLPDRSRGRIGIEIDGEQNFYFQLFFSDVEDNLLVQLGTGF